MMKIQLFILIFSLFAGLNGEQEKTILFLGDSLTNGDGVAKELAFPALVGNKIKGVNAINQGRSGWATSSYLRRWSEVEQELPKNADMIFIQLGANDLRIDGYSDKTVEQCMLNMEEILKRIEKIFPDAEIVLMSSTKIDYTQMNEDIQKANFGKHSNEYINNIGKKYKKLGKTKGYGFIDLHSKIPLHSTHDGAHMSEEGHKKMARVIINYLKNN